MVDARSQTSTLAASLLVGFLCGILASWALLTVRDTTGMSEVEEACGLVGQVSQEPALGDAAVDDEDIYRLLAVAYLSQAADASSPEVTSLGEAGSDLQDAVERVDQALATDAMARLAEACN